jgi:alkaline phosphatase
MKLRNLLLALVCLLAFIGVGVLYFRTWVVQKPFGIILFLGDGLTGNVMTCARLYEGGADHRLALEKLPNMALLANHAYDFAVPDDSAASSAYATGVKTNNRALSVDPHGAPLRSILEEAQKAGRSIGIVTNGKLTDPGIAAFYAHVGNSSAEQDRIAAQLCDESRLDVAFGGGVEDFLPESKEGRRKDGRDLLLELKQKDRSLVVSKAELENAPAFRTSPIIGVFAKAEMPNSNKLGSQQPSLSDMVRRAVEFLQLDPNGYLLIVDNELSSRAAEKNDAEHVLTETLDMDHAFTTALRYAGEKSLVIAAGKHGVAGMALNGFPLRRDRGVALLGLNAYGYPSVSWASGPNGPKPTQTGAAATDGATPTQSSYQINPNSPAAFFVPAALNTAEDVIAVGTGPGSERLKGFLDNTVVYKILKENL